VSLTRILAFVLCVGCSGSDDVAANDADAGGRDTSGPSTSGPGAETALCQSGYECKDGHCSCTGGGQGVTCCGPDDPACSTDPQNACSSTVAMPKGGDACVAGGEIVETATNTAYVYKNQGKLNGKYTLLIPAGVCPVRFVVVRPFYSDDAIHEEDLRTFVTAHSGAVLVADFASDPGAWHNTVLKGTGIAIAQGLVSLADTTHHPELASVPWVPMGFSGGAAFTGFLAAQFPHRTVAAVPIHGSSLGFGSGIAPSVPVLFVAGRQDMTMLAENDRKNWQQLRTKGAPVAFAPENAGHNWGHGRTIGYAYLEALLDRRLSAAGSLQAIDTNDGYLGDDTKAAVAPASSASGDPNALSWLPNESFANAWSAFVK
jgi:hypothetical protein